MGIIFCKMKKPKRNAKTSLTNNTKINQSSNKILKEKKIEKEQIFESEETIEKEQNVIYILKINLKLYSKLKMK